MWRAVRSRRGLGSDRGSGCRGRQRGLLTGRQRQAAPTVLALVVVLTRLVALHTKRLVYCGLERLQTANEENFRMELKKVVRELSEVTLHSQRSYILCCSNETASRDRHTCDERTSDDLTCEGKLLRSSNGFLFCCTRRLMFKASSSERQKRNHSSLLIIDLQYITKRQFSDRQTTFYRPAGGDSLLLPKQHDRQHEAEHYGVTDHMVVEVRGHC